MTTAREVFSEIRECLDTSSKVRVRYARLYALLRRLCQERAERLHTDFSGLFSLLYAVCRAENIDYHAADRFRRNARLVLAEQRPAEEAELRRDVARLCTFVCALFHCELPPGLPRIDREVEEEPLPRTTTSACRRGVVTGIGADALTCLVDGRELEVALPGLGRTLAVAEVGMAVNLLDVSEMPNGVSARMAILEPDYLLDVSALTACVKPYGAGPLNYLLDQLSPKAATLPILLGNAANQFMDDCINGATTADDSLRRHFESALLDYACSAEEITPDYFRQARRQFDNIQAAVRERFSSPEVGIRPEEVLLEPSFICEKLGLRGRLDVMTADHRRFVELKSGKAEGFGGRPLRPRPEHVLQMSLYKEILHYNLGLPRDVVASFLFYSAYPVFFNERSSAQAVSDVLELRNEIVALEARLRRGAFPEILPLLKAESLNERQLDNRLYRDYLKPALDRLVLPLQRMSGLEKAYFSAFVTFVEQEKYLSKTSDGRPDSNRGFAATWRADLTTKLFAGDILINLRLRDCEGNDGIEVLEFDVPDYGDRFIANFNVGEMVQLYERSAKTDNVTNRQLVRGYIEVLTDTRLRLRLAYKQRNRHFFSATTLYAVEHDASDSPFTHSLRGLYALMAAPPSRRDLLLGLRRPEVDDAVELLGTYPPATARIVLQARRARDYFLLVGPPGTGKTSVALCAMVEEFLLSRRARTTGEDLLLTAYTNRAVDEICAMLERLGADYVRIGLEQTCGADYRHSLLSARASGCRTRAEVRRLLLDVPVVVGTVTTLSAHQEIFNIKRFDMAIIDEASQVLEPQLAGLLSASRDGVCAIRRFVMIGDHKQLPAVVLSPPSRTRTDDPQLHAIGLFDLRNSLFERLHWLQRRSGQGGVVALLDRQGRMHVDICGFVNRAFYADRLKAVPLSHQTGPLPFRDASGPLEHFVASTRLGFVDVRPAGPVDNNKANAAEADMVARLVEALVSLHARGGIPFEVGRQVGIIVPFRNQISMIRGALRRRGVPDSDALTIDTVECYQGSQRDFILFSTTVSRPYQLDILSVLHETEGQPVDRKLNVAITRARLQLIIVGNAPLLSRSPLYKHLLAACTHFSR